MNSINQKQHGILEDVAGEIGYTATSLLVDWFGGIGQLYVPISATEDHPITKVIGMQAMQRLVKMFEHSEPHERFVWLSQNEQRDIARRDRLIAALVYLGLGAKQISVLAGMSERHVFAARLRVEQLGILPMMLKRSGVEDMQIAPVKKRGRKPAEEAGVDLQEKAAAENQGQKSQAKPGGKTQGEKPGGVPVSSGRIKPRYTKVPAKKIVKRSW